MLIENSERFKKEYTDFNNKCAEITDARIKNEVIDLLNQLLSEVRKIDRQHSDLILGSNRLAPTITQDREIITNIRKKIIRKLSEWERSSIKS